MSLIKNLNKKINNKSAVITIVGVGYVGLGLLNEFSKHGYTTYGLDINLKKLKNSNFNKKVTLTKDYRVIKKTDIIIITLPTPLNDQLNPDLTIIKKSIKTMETYLKKGQLISFESTTYPGSTNELFVTLLSKKFILGKDFFLVYSPERISPEFKTKDLKLRYGLTNTPKIISGFSDNCKLLGQRLYKKIISKIVISPNIKTAETSKMIENTFRSVNIALVNELKMFLTKMDIDIHSALKLADTKPFGFTKFEPGPGFGGHCIPVDPFYLYWLAKKKKFQLNFIKNSGVVNRKITSWIVNKLISHLKKKKIKKQKSKVLILGITYKANIDDTRESPAFKIMEKLKSAGYDTEFSDPYVKQIKIFGVVKKSKYLNKKTFKEHPVVIIVSDHSKFDYKFIANNAQDIFDARNSKVQLFRKENYFKV